MKKKNLKIFISSISILLISILCSYAQVEFIEPFFDAKEVKDILEDIKIENFMYYNELLELKKKHPAIYKKIIASEIKRQRLLSEMKETKPEIYNKLQKVQQLEKKTKELAKQYLATSQQERKAELKIEMRNILSELFDLREEKYNIEIKELEEEINRLKDRINKRKGNKEKIIDKRLESLTSEQEYLEW
ncbi:MAG: hypothetical protein AB1633_10450 [Elusimicrobiota bacterium]